MNTVPEYLFKVNVIQSLFRFRSDEDVDQLLNKKGSNDGENEELEIANDSGEFGSEYE